jgi:hypothetical protein
LLAQLACVEKGVAMRKQAGKIFIRPSALRCNPSFYSYYYPLLLFFPPFGRMPALASLLLIFIVINIRIKRLLLPFLLLFIPCF